MHHWAVVLTLKFIQEVVRERRTVAKLSSAMESSSQPMQDILTALVSCSSDRLLHPVEPSHRHADITQHPLTTYYSFSWNKLFSHRQCVSTMTFSTGAVFWFHSTFVHIFLLNSLKTSIPYLYILLFFCIPMYYLFSSATAAIMLTTYPLWDKRFVLSYSCP